MDFVTDNKNNSLTAKVLRHFPPGANVVEISDPNALDIICNSLNLYIDKALEQNHPEIMLLAALNNGKWIDSNLNITMIFSQ